MSASAAASIHRVDRIADERLDAFALQDLGDGLDDFHVGASYLDIEYASDAAYSNGQAGAQGIEATR